MEENYCSHCGKVLRSGAAFCEHCGASAKTGEAPQPRKQPKIWTKTPLAGVLGAVIGAGLGGSIILALYTMGYFAAISGIVLALGTLKGYELLGGPHTRGSLALCVVLMLVTPLFADTIHWALIICQAYADYHLTLWEALQAIPMFLAQGAIDPRGYLQNLLILYGFTVFGAVGVFAAALKKKDA